MPYRDATPYEMEQAPMTCQIATVLSALLAVSPAQASEADGYAEARLPTPAKVVAGEQRQAVRRDAQGRATLKAVPGARPGHGAKAGS